MLRIQQITQDPLQRQNIVLPDGSSFTLTMYYIPLQQGWFIQELTYNDFTLNNLRITVSPNILYQWKNYIPFGISCVCESNREPSLQEDFSSGAAKLYVLTEDEVTSFTEYLANGG